MILPAILPGLFVTLRLNLFAAWMVVLIAEAVGVGSGLGQVVMMARNTFNASLVFFTMTLIGLAGFAFDQACAGCSGVCCGGSGLRPWEACDGQQRSR